MNCYFHPSKLKETQGKAGTLFTCPKCKSIYRFIIVTNNNLTQKTATPKKNSYKTLEKANKN